MTEKPRVVIVGSFNTDLAVRAPHIPVGGETILGGGFQSGPGGKGANQAVAAARLGAETSLLVKLGKDLFGDQAAENRGATSISRTISFHSARTPASSVNPSRGVQWS